ncbi:cytochrome P450 [Sistotremastrum suecicum HHB10207 ss-3]|uniref:Cytochrome P450 n=1 Tax=Sistotremastrum suecicum HHB10207 ss-3 TaxID=1314776 RepID=A0A166F5R1_9AGAM|nr:cytochrome P450 [Sistotremastrum suecicum HHB10207 ss-3]
MAITVLFASFLFVALFLWSNHRRSSRRKPQSPPGPKPHWLVGHTFQVPQTKAWLYFEKLGKEFGPIVKLSLAGDDIVVLNDPKDAEELLNKRSSNYSSRKPLIYAGRYLSGNKRLVLLPYGPTLKKQRQAFHQMLQPRVVGSYESMQLLESSKFLYDMLTSPETAFLNCKRFSASLVFYLSYGRRLSPDDADLTEVLSILDSFIEDCYPGTHLLDTFPFLDFDYAWFRKMFGEQKWKEQAREKHDREVRFYGRLLGEVKDRMSKGEVVECFAARLWEQKEKHELDEESMAYVAGSAFEAGTGTTSGSIQFFIMAMILYPHVLQKARKEIDSIVGEDSESPPTFEHYDQLPYCVALCKEVFRWIPAAPGGFPHYSDEDDEYQGYEIRAKTMVIPNIWAMQHNEQVFPDPKRFIPERFLGVDKADELTEGHWAFGFGRRICPGRYMGAKSVWIGIVQLIWAFNIGPDYDKDGNPIPIDVDAVTSGINIEPLEFGMRLTPRSERHANCIRRMWNEMQNKIQ